MYPPAKERVFDLERKDDEEEGSGHRSILGLERIEFAPVRKAAPVEPALPSAEASVPTRGDSLPPSVGHDLDPEDSSRRSLLGLERIELEPGWKAAVAASPLQDRPAAVKPAILARPTPRAEEEDESNHQLLLGLERSEFALGRRRAAPLPPKSVPAPATLTPAQRKAERDRLSPRDLLSLRDPLAPAQIDPPQFEQDLAPRVVAPIPIERAILLSLVAHVLLFLLLLWAPPGTAKSRGGLLAGLFPPPTSEDQNKVPIVFRSAPGPERENPKPSDLSDKTRRAGGGDRSRPKAETPFVPQRPGVEGLSPGAGRSARAAPPPRPAGESQEKTASGAAGERLKPAPEGFQVPPPGSSSGSQGPKIADLQRAIQDAAREVGTQGQGGAGAFNPEGGFVDSGPISFDTSWYDWGPYAEEMVRRIKLHWEIPELARLGWKGRLTVRFFILADGTVEGAKIISRSGIPPFDFAALNAILKSDPFKPLPRDLLAQVPGKDREGITVTFFYNIRPERE